MKRLLIPLLLLLCGACTNTIDYDFDQVKPALMVTGWLEQASPSQTIYVSLSEGGIVKPVKDARVVCTVNGKEVADVHAEADLSGEQSTSDAFLLSMFGISDLSYYQQLPVSFPATLKPGDKVQLTIEANQGTYKASTSELTVPEPIEITKVDTTRVTVQHLDWNERYLQVRADVPDRKGEDNWYFIALREISEGTYSFTDGGPDISVTVDDSRHMQDMDDPILLDGNLSQTEDLIFFDFSGNGSFACFPDQLFRDGTAHLKMNVFSSWSDEGPDFRQLASRLVTLYDIDELEARGFEKCRAKHRLEIHLSHCTQSAYFYLRSLRTVLSEGYYPEIVEPVTVPTNIIGGVGYVDIVNTAVARIDLPAQEEVYLEEDSEASD